MIIECGHCGAPLNVASGASIAKCTYCDTSNRVQELRTVAAETPQDWRPPPQWVPPAHAIADSTQTLTYHAAAVARGAVRMVIGLVSTLVLVSGAAAAFFVFNANQSVNRRSQDLNNTSSGVRAKIADAMNNAQKAVAEAKKAQGAAIGGGSQTSLLTSQGVSEALAGYKAAQGVQSLKLQQLVLHETHSSAKAQSPKNPKNVDSFRYRSGRVTGPEPVRLSTRDKKTLKTLLFDPDKTALKKLDELKTTALGKLAYEEARISHVIVDRRRGKTNLRIYGSSPRDSGYVLFNDAGKVVRVYR